MATDGAKRLLEQDQRLALESRELEVLHGSTEGEVQRQRAREEQTRAKLEELRRDPARPAAEIFAAYDEHALAIERRITMEGQLSALDSKLKLLGRVRGFVAAAAEAARDLPEQPAAAPPPTPKQQAQDEGRFLRAVVDTQEEERRRIARAVHDGPAQALSNVVLQTEISERLFEVDPQRSRAELATLRQLVNRTLQELRAFIFELRPMILDDLGLVPTLRRYVQTLIDKHAVKIHFNSSGRDRRLPADDEVAVFRLIQDALLERIEQGKAKTLHLVMNWEDAKCEVSLQSDGQVLPSGPELAAGVRRSERLQLLRAEATQEQRPDGTFALDVQVPLRPVQTIS